MNNVSTRFTLLEMLRIVLPGAYFLFLCYTLAIAFGVLIHPFATWEFGIPFFLLGSVVAGLSFYSKETPKKRKAFSENQPSLRILELSRQMANVRPLTEDEARRLYFYILNHLMPVTVHDKIFFFGMVYHVMISIRRTSFWFGIAGIAGIILQVAFTGTTALTTVSPIAVIWLVYILNVRHNKADRKMQENFQDQIFWLDMHRETVAALILQRSQHP